MAFFRGGLLLSVESNCLVIKEAVGEGAFGQVFKVKDQEDGQLYALKVIHTKENNPRASRGAIREVKTLRKVNHDHILEIFGADKFKADRSEGLYVLTLTEFCSGGNLNERLSRRSSHEKNLKWMKQLASALSYLHDEDIVHRDLKPENVLLTDRRQEDIKIGDFGLAREYLALKHVEISDWLSFYNTYYMETVAGTYPYIAPEVFSQHYTEEADVFSLGCIFYAILKRDFITGNHGKRLYGAFVSVRGRGKLGLGEAMWIHPNRNYMVEFDTTENTTRKLMNRATLDALQCDPNDRPSADNISYGMELISSANSPDEDLSYFSGIGLDCSLYRRYWTRTTHCTVY